MIGSDLSHHLPSILEAYEWGQTIRLSAYPDFYSNFLETNDAIIRPANEKSCWESFIEGFQAFFAAIFACLCCDYRTELERTQDFLLDRTHTMSAVIQKLCDLSAYINTNINKLPIEEVASANALIINTLESRCRHYEAHDKDEIHLALATSLDIDALACNEHLNVREPKIIPQSLTVQSTLEQLVLKDLRLRRHSYNLLDAKAYIDFYPKAKLVQQAIAYILKSYQIHEMGYHINIRTILRNDAYTEQNSYQEDLANMPKASANSYEYF